MSGFWSQEGVPHKGWSCIGVSDTRENDGPGDEPSYSQCEMCNKYPIRYVHHMQHADYSGVVSAGCECAAKMEMNYQGAARREERMRKRAARRSGWLGRKWKKSKKGDPYIKSDNFVVGLYRKSDRFGWWIKMTPRIGYGVETRKDIHYEPETRFSTDLFYDESRAKIAAFNAMEKWKDEIAGL